MGLRILITGGTGQVGTELRSLDWPEGVEIVAPSRGELDLSNPGSVSGYLDGTRFDAIISSGAYTAVDKAESDVAAAWAVNALAPAILAAHAKSQDIPIVHVSTDYVFDGTKAGPYFETDPVAPVSVYGASKEGGEQAVRTAAPRHAIVRTSWVVSPHGHNFIKTMLRLGRERDMLRVVDDQWGAPTSAADLARALHHIALTMMGDRHSAAGTFHFTNAGETTWCRVAREIFDRAAPEFGRTPAVEAIATADYPTPARRPANSRLSTDGLTTTFAISPRPWQAAVAEIITRLTRPEVDA